ncbi:hypothetical protein BC936DRAFT_146254 [Jimgerdemannia flammicorona]|uniref:SWIM-type domain-containing protein n=1 Tax=Jimgerdemannia flammicorona TaxID=994334 RepID=A0A433D806_9FUNG|nr:hypothetical protein BC936DRAFT_146254 [Jimgerdemannia flammicorona]
MPSTVVFTGTLQNGNRKDFIKRAEQAGFVCRDNLSRDVDYLVCGVSPGSRVTDAKKMGIKVLSEVDWDKLLKAQSATTNGSSSASPSKRSASDDEDIDQDSDNDKADRSAAKKAKLPTCKYGAQCYRKNPDHLREYYHPKPATASASKKTTSSSSAASSSSASSSASPKAAGSSVPSFTRQLSKDILATDGDTDIAVEDPSQPGLNVTTTRTNSKSDSDKETDSDEGDGVTIDPATGAFNSVLPKKHLADGETITVASSTSTAQWTVKRTGDTFYCTCPSWRNQNAPTSQRSCKHLREVLGEEYERERVGLSAWVFGSGIMTSSSQKAKSAAKHAAPDVLLAHKWDPDAHDPVGWWISEKLDGVRAFWHSKRGVFLSRLGNEYQAPDWFVQGLPKDQDLDGELFGGRSKFSETVSIVKTPGSSKWKGITYQIFDIPSKKEKFEDRMEAIKVIVDTNKPPFARIVKHTLCTSVKHLTDTLAKIESKGGEGVMIRKPESLYVGGRSTTLLKVKTFLDGEALIIGYEPGKGKYQNSTGALKVQMASGKLFKVASGMSDKERKHPPKLGAIVVYKCQELSKDGVPRFPIYLGVAADKTKPTDPDMTSKGGNQAGKPATGHNDD